MPVLYHGTPKANVPGILKRGIRLCEGWGGAGTSGVYLSGTIDGAIYWAKVAWLRDHHHDVDTERFERYCPQADKCIAVLKVTIPPSHVCCLRADMEQYEDVQLPPEYNDPKQFEKDWQASLRYIRDVRFTGKIPPEWIEEVKP